MTYRHFGDYLDSLKQYDDRLALTIRPFLKIQHLNFKMLRGRANQVAHYLLTQGVTSGQRIMIIAPNSPQWVELFLGAELIGAVIVPVDITSSLEIVQRFIAMTEPALIFKSQYMQPSLTTSCRQLLLDELDTSIQSCSFEPVKIKLHGDNPALIVFTSGTTADPKGVLLTQKNILSNVEGVQAALEIDPNWRVLSVLPLTHMYEITGGLLSVLSKGASIFYVPRVSPLAIAQAMQLYQITTILAIPQLLVLFLERIQQTAAREGKENAFRFASMVAKCMPLRVRHIIFSPVHKQLGGHLRLVVTGGAPIPPDVEKAWERMGVQIIQGYGLTETAPILTANRFNKHRLNSAGLPLENVQLRIGADHEIQAKGPNIFSSYWHNEAATKEVFTKDGWFKTGDTGVLKHGWLYIQGRLKFAIVRSSGLKVFPEDIEHVAASISVLKSLCIVSRKIGVDETVLAVTTSDLSDTDIESQINTLNSKLESFQHVDGWCRWHDADFPRTRLLKIDRRKVQLWANDKTTADSKQKNDSNTSDSLQTIIKMSLGDQPLGALHDSDTLAGLGLDSLRRLNLIALTEEHLTIAVSEAAISGQTTVGEYRKLILAGQPSEPAKVIPQWQFTPIIRWLGNWIRDVLIFSIVRIWVTAKVEGRENIVALEEPALFIFNHTDDFDAPVVYHALPYRIRSKLTIAMAADVIAEHKILAFIARLCFGAFNFSRQEPYLPSLEYVCKMYDLGWHIALSPEGRIRNKTGLQSFKSGIGLLAVNLGAPVIIVKTSGLQGTVPLHAKWPKKRSNVTIKISEPVRFEPTTDFDVATINLYNKMEAL